MFPLFKSNRLTVQLNEGPQLGNDENSEIVIMMRVASVFGVRSVSND